MEYDLVSSTLICDEAIADGPPGTGKTLLARAMPAILPRTTIDDDLDITRIYSVRDQISRGVPLVRKGQIILALSNPNLEIDPELGLLNGADGKPVNNVLGFPGIFRGAADTYAPRISHEMPIAATQAIAEMTRAGDLGPNPLDKKLHMAVPRAMAEASIRQGIARAEYIPYVEE